ncbi:MAG: LCP family protein, partial [Clostridium sp.]
IILGAGAFGAYKYVNKIKNVELKSTDSELKVSEETVKKSERHNVKNILLLGVDEEENVSDTIMILSLDKDDKSAKITSVMRDTQVFLGDDKVNKINYAYNYGGPELTITTLNELFDLDINKYAKVSFDGLANVVDYLGGIELNITEQERLVINRTSELKAVSSSGKVTLNGKQALAYSRIRSIDSDYVRTSRQRDVMLGIFKKAKGVEVTSYPKVISDLSSNVQTNLSLTELLDMAGYVMSLNTDSLNEFRIPMDGTTQDIVDEFYYLGWDKELNTKELHKFIYGEE